MHTELQSFKEEMWRVIESLRSHHVLSHKS